MASKHRSVSNPGSRPASRISSCASVKDLEFISPTITVEYPKAHDEVIAEIVKKPLTHMHKSSRQLRRIKSACGVSNKLSASNNSDLKRTRTSYKKSNLQRENTSSSLLFFKDSENESWVISNSRPVSKNLCKNNNYNVINKKTKLEGWVDTADSVPRQEQMLPLKHEHELENVYKTSSTSKWASHAVDAQCIHSSQFANALRTKCENVAPQIDSKFNNFYDSNSNIRVGINGKIVSNNKINKIKYQINRNKSKETYEEGLNTFKRNSIDKDFYDKVFYSLAYDENRNIYLEDLKDLNKKEKLQSLQNDLNHKNSIQNQNTKLGESQFDLQKSSCSNPTCSEMPISQKYLTNERKSLSYSDELIKPSVKVLYGSYKSSKSSCLKNRKTRKDDLSKSMFNDFLNDQNDDLKNTNQNTEKRQNKLCNFNQNFNKPENSTLNRLDISQNLDHYDLSLNQLLKLQDLSDDYRKNTDSDFKEENNVFDLSLQQETKNLVSNLKKASRNTFQNKNLQRRTPKLHLLNLETNFNQSMDLMKQTKSKLLAPKNSPMSSTDSEAKYFYEDHAKDNYSSQNASKAVSEVSLHFSTKSAPPFRKTIKPKLNILSIIADFQGVGKLSPPRSAGFSANYLTNKLNKPPHNNINENYPKDSKMSPTNVDLQLHGPFTNDSKDLHNSIEPFKRVTTPRRLNREDEMNKKKSVKGRPQIRSLQPDLSLFGDSISLSLDKYIKLVYRDMKSNNKSFNPLYKSYGLDTKEKKQVAYRANPALQTSRTERSSAVTKSLDTQDEAAKCYKLKLSTNKLSKSDLVPNSSVKVDQENAKKMPWRQASTCQHPSKVQESNLEKKNNDELRVFSHKQETSKRLESTNKSEEYLNNKSDITSPMMYKTKDDKQSSIPTRTKVNDHDEEKEDEACIRGVTKVTVNISNKYF